jgi:hypothetical protein
MRHLLRTFLYGALTAACVLSSVPAHATGDDDEDEGTPAPAESEPAESARGERTPAPAPAPAANGVPVVHREGDYGGVSPGEATAKSGKAASARKKRGRVRPLVTWVGFQAREAGAARVFVQLTTELPFEQRVAGDALVVFVPGARLGTRNHGRFIDTSFFDTRVARVDASNVRARRGRKAGVEVTIRFKKGAPGEAQASQETSPDGHRFLYFDFAP